ncbi:MAG: hypothetical protein A2504_02805 [Bdellovibrionales bacterium RIFOXYD12_FULL_39_22]|nr:MAG: hypothetical protein A2385_05520 [Bdellovibrionales bacterium RIFOXYB1_FULL_39_21]OFZ42215.1 MAG: hypothetical protein A2485_15550 [Bdellovibrionales bacterium RIFOXYC12_FULL_39_17]OFZ46693.1 MAG: hypothetical protein A2404_04120 [Bdellovibrionales bacterium RIFOXYC1_FULL_39_130]OFZ76030.1 MAG: hypothetical protein A2560_03030 [Bdellovibrionales bacterium RIFOXYD1_FULL_39_84]OFZ93014.1 MAG: hypothetical protein A2504_02805 [Bdellovibrionales bacterium RIFOXYD12_FULL_39_22]HLE09904.1 hy
MKVLLSVMFLFVISSTLWAEEKKPADGEKKDTTVALRGEKIPAAGYKVYFTEDKKEYLQFSGYMRLYYHPETRSKLTMPYFRFLVDGRTSDNWSFHSRMDYAQKSFMSVGTKHADLDEGKATGHPGVYWARAYGTYHYSDKITFDFGRVIDQVYRYDLLKLPAVNVDLGAGATAKVGDIGIRAVMLYKQPNTVYTNNKKEDVEEYLANARAGYTYKISEKVSLEFGLAAGANSPQHAAKFFQLIPDITFTANDFYLLDLCLLKQDTPITGPATNTTENYIEAGYTIIEPFTVDAYLRTTIVSSTTTHDPGIDVVYKWGPEITFVGNAELSDLANKEKKDFFDRMSYTAYVEYMF